jgi:trehalose 2-sulfotransferase
MTADLRNKRNSYYEEVMSPTADTSNNGTPNFRYCIASLPRTGSTLLTRMLTATQQAGSPNEYLNAEYLHAWQRLNPDRPLELLNYLHEIEQRRSTSNGHFGIKIHWRQLHKLADSSKLPTATLADKILAPYKKFILILRRDKLAQAISLFIANQTSIYNKDQERLLGTNQKVKFNGLAISTYIARLLEDEVQWRQYLQQRKMPYMEMNYEDLANDYERVSRSVLDFLELDCPAPPMPLEKLQNSQNSEFNQLYLQLLTGV